MILCTCLQCFYGVGWATGRASSLKKKLSGGMLVWLYVWVKVQICTWPSWCHCHLLSVAAVSPGWFYLPGFTFLVPAHPGSPGQNPRGRKMVVCVWLWFRCFLNFVVELTCIDWQMLREFLNCFIVFMIFVDFVIAGSCYCTWQPGVQCSCNYSLGQCICWTSKLSSWWQHWHAVRRYVVWQWRVKSTWSVSPI